jgi:hypothetical protein
MNLKRRLKTLTDLKEGKEEEERHKAYSRLRMFTHIPNTYSTHPCIFPYSKPDNLSM